MGYYEWDADRRDYPDMDGYGITPDELAAFHADMDTMLLDVPDDETLIDMAQQFESPF